MKKAKRTESRTRAKTKRTKPRHARPAGPAKEGDAIDALVAASAQALGIPLDPSWHTSVAFNMRLILTHAAKVDGFRLPDDAEPAAIFHA
ncbi:MAG TPA: DUF4089 domain-containing protein [Xanthobacteraceae bacterium]|nr:DUF4089 domain-containing protein [Xanthobacteraceae bacterium]